MSTFQQEEKEEKARLLLRMGAEQRAAAYAKLAELGLMEGEEEEEDVAPLRVDALLPAWQEAQQGGGECSSSSPGLMLCLPAHWPRVSQCLACPCAPLLLRLPWGLERC